MFKKGWIILLPLVFIFSSLHAANFVEGTHYQRIASPVTTSNPDKVVVTEVFWYGCPHCFRFEPYVDKWKENLPEGVEFELLPSVLNASWMEHARAYFALQQMGELDKVHKKIFSAIHLQRKRLTSVDTIAEFVAEQGVDEKQFRNHYHSFPVDTMVRKVRKKEKQYGHNGVPAVIVNGKYLTSGSMAGSNSAMIEVINFLVDKELAAK